MKKIDRIIPLDSCDHPDISCFKCSFSHECTRYGIKDEEENIDPCFHCHNLGIVDCGACSYHNEFPPGKPRTRTQEFFYKLRQPIVNVICKVFYAYWRTKTGQRHFRRLYF
jgi:hypothetical protein